MSTSEQTDGLRPVPLSPAAVSAMLAALYVLSPRRLESVGDPEPPLAA